MPSSTTYHIITTGGTIAAPLLQDGTYGTATLSGEVLLKGIPLEWHKQVRVHNLTPKISHNEDISDYSELRNLIEKLSSASSRILITTGTNTLPVKLFYQSLVTLPDQRVVFTGANYPYGSSQYDGWNNITDSLRVLHSDWPNDIRTLCIFHGEIIAPYSCYKGQSQDGSLTLQSHAGCELGIVDTKTVKWNSALTLPSYFQYRDVFSKLTQLPWIPIYYDHPGGEKTLELLLKEKPSAIVVVGAAQGFVNEALIAKITATGIPIMRTSMTTEVTVKWRSRYDDRYHTIPAGTLSPAQAQILMSFAISAGIDLKKVLSA